MTTIQTNSAKVGRGKRRQTPTEPTPTKRRLGPILAVVLASATCGAGAMWFAVRPHTRAASMPVSAAQVAPTPGRELSRFDLFAMSPEELANVDVAEINLACAVGLPGSDRLDRKAVLAKLDQWAATVKAETERHLYRVNDPKYAEHYHHSESYLRCEFLIQTLQEKCGVRYNPDCIDKACFEDSRASFIHGMLDPTYGGTCASMPVLYAAIGRRLGYPLRLATAKQHMFCRWESATERFNVDGAANGGWSSDPDEKYRTWPAPITQEEIDRGEFLKSLTPTEELADFLLARSACEVVNHKLAEGRASVAEAHRLVPQSHLFRDALTSTFVAQRPLTIPSVPPRSNRPNQALGPPDPQPGQVYPGGARH